MLIVRSWSPKSLSFIPSVSGTGLTWIKSLVSYTLLQSTRQHVQTKKRKNVNDCSFPMSLLRFSYSIDEMIVKRSKSSSINWMVLSLRSVGLKNCEVSADSVGYRSSYRRQLSSVFTKRYQTYETGCHGWL